VNKHGAEKGAEMICQEPQVKQYCHSCCCNVNLIQTLACEFTQWQGRQWIQNQLWDLC